MSKSKSKNKYIPSPQFNPIVLSKKIENLQTQIDNHKNLLQTVNRANDLHVEHLSNFVRHDMKNAIQGVDGILYNSRKSHRYHSKENGTVRSSNEAIGR